MSRTLSAEAFRDFIADQQQQIARAFQEVEQVQAEYQGMYTRFKADHDRTLLVLVNKIESTLADALGAALRKQIDARVPVERKAIADRIAKLEKGELPDLQRQADYLIQKGQKETTDLRKINPKLNDREEMLKRDLAHWQQTLDDLNAQVSTLGGGWGVILHARKIHDLDRERFRVIGRMESLSKELSKVRQDWKDLYDMVDKNQAEWKAWWQKKMAQLGELKQEHDYLAQNTDTLARHRAILFVVDNLKEPVPDAPSALDAALKQMIELNIQTDQFQAALGSVAGMLGIAKGVDEGLRRFGESTRAVLNEQARHSAYLPPLQIELIDSVLAFGAVWDDLAAKVKDEKALAQHPADFIVAMKPFLDERLTKDHITAFFDTLGKAMARATSRWKG
jgi:chromosome segregation ATPase